MYIDYSRIVAVTNRWLVPEGVSYLEKIEQIGQMHPKAVIVREKDMAEEDYEKLAAQVIKIMDKYDVTCILHNFPDAAFNLGCRRIHLPLAVYKSIADNGYITPAGHNLLQEFDVRGTSVHSLKDVEIAESLGATYMTAGHIYATDCKKGLEPRGIEFLKDICSHASVPVYAIGGIHFDDEQIDEVLSAGAAGACIMSGFYAKY